MRKLTEKQAKCMAFIAYSIVPPTNREIAAELGILNGSAHQVTEQLVCKGLLARGERGRARSIWLTIKGRAMFPDSGAPRLDKALSARLGGMVSTVQRLEHDFARLKDELVEAIETINKGGQHEH